MGASTGEQTGGLSGADFDKGVAFDELQDERPILGHADGEPVVVVRTGTAVHAVGASCTHYGGPLAEGLVVAGTIRCPWHHACFDLATGAVVGAPALRSLPCFDVVRTGDLVQVRAKKTEKTAPPSAGPTAGPSASPSAAKAAVAPSSVVVIGAGAAGAACVEMLRAEAYEGPITMLGDEEPGPVDRPNLSKDYLAGTAPEDWIPLGTRERYAELRVDLSPADPATAIDTKQKIVTTRTGRRVSFDALLYATGAEPSRLKIEGADLPHVFTLRSLADARAIIERAGGSESARGGERAGTAKRAVVVGASFIGLEAAASLIARGLEVEVVAPGRIPLGRVLGDEVGTFLRKVHESKGTRFHLGTRPKRIREGSVELENGETLAADLVVVGIGVKPRTRLAEAAGLHVDDGVVVDASLRTSADGIWAAGDVARFPDARNGALVRIEHWALAQRHGQAAARAMLGQKKTVRDVPFFWSVHHDVTLAYVGHATTWDSATVYGSLDARDATIAYEASGTIAAVATIQRDGVSLAIEAAMERGDDAEVRRLATKAHAT